MIRAAPLVALAALLAVPSVAACTTGFTDDTVDWRDDAMDVCRRDDNAARTELDDFQDLVHEAAAALDTTSAALVAATGDFDALQAAWRDHTVRAQERLTPVEDVFVLAEGSDPDRLLGERPAALSDILAAEEDDLYNLYRAGMADLHQQEEDAMTSDRATLGWTGVAITIGMALIGVGIAFALGRLWFKRMRHWHGYARGQTRLPASGAAWLVGLGILVVLVPLGLLLGAGDALQAIWRS